MIANIAAQRAPLAMTFEALVSAPLLDDEAVFAATFTSPEELCLLQLRCLLTHIRGHCLLVPHDRGCWRRKTAFAWVEGYEKSSALSSAENDALIASPLARIEELSKRLAELEEDNAALHGTPRASSRQRNLSRKKWKLG
jgi:hypothetical protein